DALSRPPTASPSGSHGWLDPTCPSHAYIPRASRPIAALIFCTSERRLTMEPTPMATQRKKSDSRRHDARISRQAMLRMNFMSPPHWDGEWGVGSGEWGRRLESEPFPLADFPHGRWLLNYSSDSASWHRYPHSPLPTPHSPSSYLPQFAHRSS